VNTREYEPVDVGVDPPPPGTTEGTIIGSDPLATKDGDTSYVQTTGPGTSPNQVAFRLPSSAYASPTSRVWISAEAKHTEGQGGLVVYAENAGSGSGGVGITPGGDIDLTATYETHTVEVDFTSLPSFADPHLIIDPDTIFYIGHSNPLGGSATVRTTWLRIIVEGTPPLRQRNRDTSRSRNRASRQRGIRARGYL
jgi:hypothetical protein